MNAQGTVSAEARSLRMCSHSASPRSVTSTSHYFLIQRRNGTFIALPSPLQTLKCLSLVRGLADETSPSQSTDLGRTLEAPDRRNKEGSLSPLTIPPVQAPSLFPKSRLLFTAEAWALRFSNGSNKARLCKVESFTFPLSPQCPAPSPKYYFWISHAFFTGETTKQGVQKSSTTALWLWQSK